jgi:hypothetical protein
MMVPMPAMAVLIVCKAMVAGPADQNAGFTKHQNLDWHTEHSMMVCRRQEITLTDVAADNGAEPQPFNTQRCMRSGLALGAAWDAGHPNSRWRFWRIACPVPIVRKNPDGTEDVIAWKLPDCGHRDTVICEVDTAI